MDARLFAPDWQETSRMNSLRTKVFPYTRGFHGFRVGFKVLRAMSKTTSCSDGIVVQECFGTWTVPADDNGTGKLFKSGAIQPRNDRCRGHCTCRLRKVLSEPDSFNCISCI